MILGDETRPVCHACSKKNRPCRWDEPFTKFKDYQPDASPATTADGVEGDKSESEDFQMDLDSPDMVDGSMDSRIERPTPSHSDSTTSTSQPSSRYFKHSPSSPLLLSGRKETQVGTPAEITRPQQLLTRQSRAFSHAPISLTREEASMVHHYSEYLGRWLDCTDATRQFTLGIPLKVKSCHVLLNAVQSFAACHRGDVAAAGITYQQCIALLIERLNEDSASHDETLLCAIVILRFVEQLNGKASFLDLNGCSNSIPVPSSTGSDEEQHLAGCSAIIRTSQGHHYVDPSAPSLREAAFWVYVRQCLYNATINQQPPDIDLSLRLHPPPSSMHDSHPLAHLRMETAWANQMTWYTACVVNFCFEGSEATINQASKSNSWEVLWQSIETWAKERPSPFNPIYEGKTDPSAVFADIWFTADWHGSLVPYPEMIFRL